MAVGARCEAVFRGRAGVKKIEIPVWEYDTSSGNLKNRVVFREQCCAKPEKYGQSGIKKAAKKRLLSCNAYCAKIFFL